MVFDRRTGLTRAGALALGSPFFAFQPKRAEAATTQPLSTAVLAAFQSAFINLLTNTLNGTVSAADFNLAAAQTILLTGNCYETNFDAMFITAINSIDTTQVDYSINGPIVSQSFSTAVEAGAPISLADAQTAFGLIMPPSQIQQQITQLRTNGLTPSLISIRQFLMQTASLFQVSSNNLDKPTLRVSAGTAHLRRISGCGTLNFVTSAVGTAPGSLAFGCMPEPFFMVICPAVGGLGVAALCLGIVDWVIC